MNFVVLYCNKNQYEMFEDFAFKHSPEDFTKVTICVYDDNSTIGTICVDSLPIIKPVVSTH